MKKRFGSLPLAWLEEPFFYDVTQLRGKGERERRSDPE